MEWATELSECKDPSNYAYCTCAEYSCGYTQSNQKNYHETPEPEAGVA